MADKTVTTLLFILAILSIAGLMCQTYVSPVTGDETYLYDYALKTSHGQLPYKDFNAHYGPMSYMVWGWSIDLFGENIRSMRITEIVLWVWWFAVTSYMVYRITNITSVWIWISVNVLFFQESPNFTMTNYAFVLPLGLGVAVKLHDYMVSGKILDVILCAILTILISLWRVDSFVFVGLSCFLILAFFLRWGVIIYSACMLAFILSCVMVLFYLVPISSLIDTIEHTLYVVTHYHSNFWDGFLPQKTSHILLRFPIWAPILMAIIGMGKYIETRDTMVLILTVFIIAFYNQTIYCCQVPHVTGSLFYTLVLGVYLLKDRFQSGQ